MSALSRFVVIASSFKAVFFDQYGVLHDGRNPYPGARDALAALKSRGVKIVVLSNSGRTGAANAARMAALGFELELYDFGSNWCFKAASTVVGINAKGLY